MEIIIAPNMLLVAYCILNKTYTSAILDAIEVIVVVVAIIKHSKQLKQIIG